jgi:uncharacterized membrane protein
MSGAADRRKERHGGTKGVQLSEPRRLGRLNVGLHYDPEAFGRFSESVARFLGTARFLVIQTVLVVVWVAVNVVYGLVKYGHVVGKGLFDPYPFILLTLVLSLQAAYAAPLILLSQNRQELRDRRASEQDRDVASRTQADTEFVARELASIRIALSDVASSEELDDAIERVLERVLAQRDKRAADAAAAASGSDHH